MRLPAECPLRSDEQTELTVSTARLQTLNSHLGEIYEMKPFRERSR